MAQYYRIKTGTSALTLRRNIPLYIGSLAGATAKVSFQNLSTKVITDYAATIVITGRTRSAEYRVPATFTTTPGKFSFEFSGTLGSGEVFFLPSKGTDVIEISPRISALDISATPTDPTPTYIAPSASGAIPNATWAVNLAITPINAALYFSGTSLVFTSTAVAGVSIGASSGLISGAPQSLQAATTYTVTASNDLGSATRSFLVTVVDTPARMAAPSVTASPSTLTVIRGPVPADNGSAITSYETQYSTDQITWTNLPDTTDPMVISGLASGTLFYVQTRAVNIIGATPIWSPSGTATTPAISGDAPVIANLAYSGVTNEITFELTEASNYPVTVYYLVENTATALSGLQVKEAVIATTPVVYGSVFATSAGPVAISPNWAGMTTGADWRFKVAAQNALPVLTPTASIYGPFDWDAVAPAIVSSVPADGATGVATSANIEITFDRTIRLGTGVVTLVREDPATVFTDIETFDVVTEVGTGAGQVSASGAVLTFNPTANTVASGLYSVKIAAGAVENQSGIDFAGIANNTTLNFTTGAAVSWTYDAQKGANRASDTTNVVSLSGITAGQKLIALVTLRDTRGITTPVGWTAGPVFTGASGGVKLTTFTKTAAGGETTVTFAEATATFGVIDATVIAFTGSGGLQATASTINGFNTSGVSPSVTATLDAYVLRVFCADQDDATITAPGGVTTIRNSGARDGHLLTIEGPLPAGAAGTKTATYLAAAEHHAITLEMEPI